MRALGLLQWAELTHPNQGSKARSFCVLPSREGESCGKKACGVGGQGDEEYWNMEGRGERGGSQQSEKKQTGLGRQEGRPHGRGTRAEKRSRASPEIRGGQHPFNPIGPIWEVGRGRSSSRKEKELSGKEAPPWRYMRMASSRREPRSWARSKGTSSCRSPASQWSPEGRSSSLLLLTRREEAERGSPAQPSATGRKQCTKCSFDFLMVSMRASCQRARTAFSGL